MCRYTTFFKKWANLGLFLFIFRSFLVTISIIQIEKSVDGVLGIRTRGRRMVDADETTELWRPPRYSTFYAAGRLAPIIRNNSYAEKMMF